MFIEHPVHPMGHEHPQILSPTSNTLKNICIPPSATNASQVNGASSKANITVSGCSQLHNVFGRQNLNVFKCQKQHICVQNTL